MSIAMPPRTTTTTIFVLFLLPTSLLSSTTFTFPSFTLPSSNITLLGDSSVHNGAAALTRPNTVASLGTIVYHNPITLFHHKTNTTSSFSTTFTFAITNPPNNPSSSFTNGFSFFLSPCNWLTGSPGCHFPFLNSSNSTGYRSVSVHYDTDVGLYVDDLLTTSTAQTGDPFLHGNIIDPKSGNFITSWIEYRSDKKRLNVSLSYLGSLKPEEPVLSAAADLSEHLQGPLYIGFSSSTDGRRRRKSTEIYEILSWSFESLEEAVSEGSSQSQFHPRNHNVSESVEMEGDAIASASSSAKNHGKRFEPGVLVVAVVSVACSACFLVVLLVLGYVKLSGVRKEQRKRLRASLDPVECCPKEFDYNELKLATRGFHVSRVIGKGSFGSTVYKAFFVSSGSIAAVKRYSRNNGNVGKSELLAEISVIANLSHRNLVQLQGWCVEKDELLIVYEFMPNGGLDKMLYPESDELHQCGNLLSWSHRFNIAVDLASVLCYLHHECEHRVVHGDIKAGNVLLDGNLNPKLGDLGIANLMGYLAPECFQFGNASEKSDVFSYGVVVLELVCGRRPIEKEGEEKMVGLVDWVWGLHSEGRVIEAADRKMNGEFQEEELVKLLMLGLCCANSDSAERPSMRRVLQILNSEEVPVLVPKVKPSLSLRSLLATDS